MRKHSGVDKRSRSLADHAYDSIRDGIMDGTYPLGAALSRRNLAAELGMSVLPVSEALQRLESEGLVESRPRVGTIIRVPSPQEVRGHCNVREALECQAARLFTEKATAEKRREILEFAIELDKAEGEVAKPGTSHQRVLEHHRRHMALHLSIAENGGCEGLARAIERNQVLVFTNVYNSFLGSAGASPADWHTSLMETLIGTDVEKSEAAMRAHVRFSLDTLLTRLEPFLRWDESKLSALVRERAAMAADE